MPANLTNKHGRQMQYFELYPRLGVDPKAARLPAEGIEAIDVDGTFVYATPPNGGRHRVMAICSCGAHVPAGRLHQHQKGRKHRAATEPAKASKPDVIPLEGWLYLSDRT